MNRLVAMTHPTAGLLNLDYTNLWIGQQVGIRIVAHAPADDQTRRRLEAVYETPLNPA